MEQAILPRAGADGTRPTYLRPIVDNSNRGIWSMPAVPDGGARASAPSTAASRNMRQEIEALERLYAFRDAPDVRAFLFDNLDLIDMAYRAPAAINDVFGEGTPLALDVLWDPEDEASNGVLFAVIRTELEPHETRPLLARLRRAWLFDAARRTRGRFNVDVEFE